MNFEVNGNPFAVGQNSIASTAAPAGVPVSFSFTPIAFSVPEPETWVTLLFGFAGMGAAVRAKRKGLAA